MIKYGLPCSVKPDNKVWTVLLLFRLSSGIWRERVENSTTKRYLVTHKHESKNLSFFLLLATNY